MRRVATACFAAGLFATAGVSSADVFTIGKDDAQDPDGWAYYIGQTFQPNEQGPHHFGELPDADTVYLHSFWVDPWDPVSERGAGPDAPEAEPLPEDAYLYPAAVLSGDSDAAEIGGTFNLGKAILADEGEGYLGRYGEYVFESPIEVQMDESYAFFLTEAASIEYWQSSPYDGGEAYWTDASTRGENYEIKAFDTDLDFEAVFTTDGVAPTTVIPEPSSMMVLAAAGGFLLTRRRF